MRKSFAILFVACSLSSCIKEVDVFLPDDPTLTNSDFKAFFQDIQPAAQTFLVNTDHDTTLNSTSGVHVYIPAGAFTTVSGGSVNGIVEVQLRNAFNKGNWVANRMSTTTQSALFEHLGAVQISAVKNDIQLKLAPSAKLTFDIPRESINEPGRLFRGINDQENRVLWLDINDQAELTQNEFFDVASQQWKTTWQWETSSTGWFACGKYLPDTPVTGNTFCVTLPEGYDETNTATFAVFQQNNSIVELEWRAASRQFCTTFIPAGYTVTLLSISAKDQHHFLGYAEAIVEASGTSIPLQPIGTTPAIFAELLDEL